MTIVRGAFDTLLGLKSLEKMWKIEQRIPVVEVREMLLSLWVAGHFHADPKAATAADIGAKQVNTILKEHGYLKE